MKHWHRCRRWWRLGLACPFGGFVGHVPQREKKRRRPKEDEGEEEEKEPVRIPIREPEPIAVPKKQEEIKKPVPPEVPKPVPVLPPAPFLPPIRLPPRRERRPVKPGVNGDKPDMRPEKLPERELEPVKNISKIIEDAEGSTSGREPFIPAFRAKLLESGERIELKIPDIPDPPFRGPRVPRHPIPAFDPRVEGVPTGVPRGFVRSTPNLKRGFAEEAVTQELARVLPKPGGIRLRRGLVAGALAGAALGAGGFAFNAANRMRALTGRGGLFMN